ncbi:MAG: DUF480 domain-containing protein [Gammaproteobacteria bacterium]
MDVCLTPYEARVIGCLLEKERTTPEQYPLSLNALTNACNQKSSREPVMQLDETTVRDTVDALTKKGYVIEKSGFGSRVAKFRHRFCNTEFSPLQFSDQEVGVVCVLLLRGPQTPGELRARTDRLCRFEDVREVEATLDGLMSRDDGPFVARLPREAGRREARYAHLFGGDVELGDSEVAAVVDGPATETDRLERLERVVAQLQTEVAELHARLARPAEGEVDS